MRWRRIWWVCWCRRSVRRRVSRKSAIKGCPSLRDPQEKSLQCPADYLSIHFTHFIAFLDLVDFAVRAEMYIHLE